MKASTAFTSCSSGDTRSIHTIRSRSIRSSASAPSWCSIRAPAFAYTMIMPFPCSMNGRSYFRAHDPCLTSTLFRHREDLRKLGQDEGRNAHDDVAHRYIEQAPGEDEGEGDHDQPGRDDVGPDARAHEYEDARHDLDHADDHHEGGCRERQDAHEVR